VIQIRPARPQDSDEIWVALEPVIRAGEVFAFPRDMEREAAIVAT
jgi:hypothetical protein